MPRKHRPELVVTWTNLTVACPVCNTNKGSYYEPDAPLLNPYTDAVEECVTFRGPAVCAVPGSDLGSRTVRKLQLRRVGLLQERAKCIERVHDLIDSWTRAAGPDKQLLEDEIRQHAAPHNEHSACVEAYNRTWGIDPVDAIAEAHA